MEELSMDLIIARTGELRCLYTDDLNLSALGVLHIRRASAVEPTADGRWTADLASVGGPRLGPFPRRSDALAAERAWLETHDLPTGNPSRPGHPTARLRALALAVLCALTLLAGCDEEGQNGSAGPGEAQRQAQREAQLQAQLASEQAGRLKAEQAAREAEASRDAWVTRLGALACLGVVVVGLLGVHVGSRGMVRFAKEHHDGPSDR